MPRKAQSESDEPAYELVLVSKLIEKQQKYVLHIEEHSDPEEPKVVPIRNGDVQYNIVRGRYWIVPEAIVTVLRDARGDKVDFQGRVVGTFKSYPFTATKYDGDLPLKTMVADDEGTPARPEVPQYA